MKSLFSKISVVCWSVSLTLLAVSSQAVTPPNQRVNFPQKKVTPVQIPAEKTSITPEIPTVIPAQIPTEKTSITPQTSTVIPAQIPTEKTLITPQIPTAIPPKTPTNNTTATISDNKLLATRLVLNLKERRVYAYKEDKVLMSYPVAIGKKGWETPTGNFQVIQMVKDPVWENPWNGKIVPSGPKGPIGERWIGFWTDGKNTIGFHGTPSEKTLGQAVSHGCVRMKNKDVKALFEIVKPGLPVVVVPK